MKSMIKVLLAVALVFSFAIVANSACNNPLWVYMLTPASHYFSGFSATRTDLRLNIWILSQDKGTPADACVPVILPYGSCLCYNDSTLFNCTGASCEPGPGCQYSSISTSVLYSNAGGWYLNYNWGTNGAGCPPLDTTSRVVTFFQDRTGNYGIWSCKNDGSGYKLDQASINPTEPARTLPALSVTSATPGAGNYALTVAWPIPAPADLKGNYDTDPGNIISGYNIYYKQAASLPSLTADKLATAWIKVGGPYATGAGTASVIVPFDGINTTYVALGPTLSSTAYPLAPFVGTPLAVIGPTPAGLFTSVSASAQRKQITTNWTTNVESGVVAYDVVYSNKKNGPFQVVPGTTTVPTGNGSSYSKTFPRPRGSDKLFIKVKATMTSGVDEYSNLVVVGGGAATK